MAPPGTRAVIYLDPDRWFYKLPFTIFLLEEGLDRFGALVVGDVEGRFVSFVQLYLCPWS